MSEPDRLAEIRWRRERKRDGWYPEDVDYLLGEVERLREELAEALERAPDPYAAEKADANLQANLDAEFGPMP